MKSRMSRCVALIGTVLSLSGFAQVCQEIPLYRNGESGKMEQSGFPEAPEWSANWGEMEALAPPYIRLSGQKDKAGDWTGVLSLSRLPATVRGGNLSLTVRTTQPAKFGVWLVGDFGNSTVSFHDLQPNRTYSLSVAVRSLLGKESAKVTKIGVGLFDVPARRYTTLFVDNVAFSCGVSAANENPGHGAGALSFDYPYSDIEPDRSERAHKFMLAAVPAVTPAYSPEKREKMRDSTNALFVLDEMEHLQVQNFVKSDPLSAAMSRNGWYKHMFFIERNRLRDSVIANPKTLFYEAGKFSAQMDDRAMPLLVANVDYAYRTCADSACGTNLLLNARGLFAGLPSASVYGSVLKLHYDPYFICTNRKNVPKVEIFAGKQWKELSPKSEMTLSFESAGIQKIQVRLTEGGLTVNQNLIVEVK